jgi:hypothetical protein
VEADGRAQCLVPGCTKRFKGLDFLGKHIRSKHTEALAVKLLRASEARTKARFDAEDLAQRPLPLVEMLSSNSAGGSRGSSVVRLTVAEVVADAKRRSPGFTEANVASKGGQQYNYNYSSNDANGRYGGGARRFPHYPQPGHGNMGGPPGYFSLGVGRLGGGPLAASLAPPPPPPVPFSGPFASAAPAPLPPPGGRHAGAGGSSSSYLDVDEPKVGNGRCNVHANHIVCMHFDECTCVCTFLHG